MKFKTLILTIVFAALSPARTADPVSGYCLVLERMTILSEKTERNKYAFEVLRLVSLGRNKMAPEKAETELGLGEGEIRKPAYSATGVRACALQIIGKMHNAQAIEFLANLQRSDVIQESGDELWTSAQNALSYARLSNIEDPRLKIEFLEGLVTPRTPSSFWAVNRLCDSGAVASLDVAKAYLKLAWSGEYGEEQSRFCEARMQVIFGNPDRAKALGSVLKIGVRSTELDKLRDWAIVQLLEMDNPTADLELSRFRMEIRKRPKNDSNHGYFSSLDGDIERLMERNREKQQVRKNLGQ